MTKGTYVLSQEAEKDLGQILNYTELEFGLDRAIKYLSEMEPVLYQLVANPMLGRERNEIRDGLRSIPYISHIIFYRIFGNQIRVVRVLHGSRDLPTLLENS